MPSLTYDLKDWRYLIHQPARFEAHHAGGIPQRRQYRSLTFPEAPAPVLASTEPHDVAEQDRGIQPIALNWLQRDAGRQLWRCT